MKNKHLIDINNPSLNKTEVPELDSQTANQLLSNVFAACDMEPSTIPVEVLESWGNYKKPKFQLGKLLTYLSLVLLILLPLMFFKPTIIATRTNVDSATDAVYDIEIKTMLPVRAVSATLDGSPVTLHQSDSKEYSAELTRNGELTIQAVSMNGQTTVETYHVTHIDTESPVFVSSYSENGTVYLTIQDTYSGIDYASIGGLTPESYDEEQGVIAFKVPAEPTTVTIPDHAGNELVLLLSPVN